MKIKSIRIQNFRSLKDVTMTCDDLTVLVGGNGVGKSCTLKAMNLFYNTNINVEKPDYYNNDIKTPISITVEYADLTPFELKKFEQSIDENNILSIEKTIEYSEKKPIQKYYSTIYYNPKFDGFRNAKGTDLKKEYNKLLTKKDYQHFPKYKRKEIAEETLQQWELANKNKCNRERDDGENFGFHNHGVHRLENYTKCIMIPAVQEAREEGMESSGSIFEEIMDVVVKSTLAQNPKLIKLEETAQTRYTKIIDSSKNKELKTLERDLTSHLSIFVPDSEVNIKWIDTQGVSIRVPSAYVTLKEGGYHNTVDRCGHGLQRAYILSLFQQLALIQTSLNIEESQKDEKSPSLQSLIIGIEEPELYQHPDRIRFFANTLLSLTKKGIGGTFEKIQILYSTHSPLLVDFRRIGQIRIFRKKSVNSRKPKVTDITETDLNRIARLIENIKTVPMNTIKCESVRQRLIQLMNPWMNEGFFANLVVLVEGIKDRALILGEALYRNKDLESLGISVILCVGKHNIPSAMTIFNSLGIPTYTVWDSDKDKKKDKSAKKANKEILRCLNVKIVDYPCRKTKNYCAVRTNLERVFREEVGLVTFNKDVVKFCSDRELGKPNYVMENPYLVAEIIKYLDAKGHRSNTLKVCVDKILDKI